MCAKLGIATIFLSLTLGRVCGAGVEGTAPLGHEATEQLENRQEPGPTQPDSNEDLPGYINNLASELTDPNKNVSPEQAVSIARMVGGEKLLQASIEKNLSDVERESPEEQKLAKALQLLNTPVEKEQEGALKRQDLLEGVVTPSNKSFAPRWQHPIPINPGEKTVMGETFERALKDLRRNQPVGSTRKKLETFR